MTGLTACPACGGGDLTEIYRLDAIPVQSCILLDTEEEARGFETAGLLLKHCAGCGFVFNAIFDLAKVDYASTTEESQHFSGTFNRFARDLVAEIASLYDLKGKHTLEIGCGKGDFLEEMNKQTETIALGVDPVLFEEEALQLAVVLEALGEHHERRDAQLPAREVKRLDGVRHAAQLVEWQPGALEVERGRKVAGQEGGGQRACPGWPPAPRQGAFLA